MFGTTDAQVDKVVASHSSAEPANPTRGLQHYEQSIKPLLKKACFNCHSGSDVEGNFRADQLDPDLVEGNDITWWLDVYSVISKEEMPPPDSNELTDFDRTRIVEWLSSEIQAAEQLRRSGHQYSPFRRLTRYEYNYALQDLLGVRWTFTGTLPDESSEEGAFENNAESLRMSVKQLESYQQLAVNALQRVTVRGEQPSPLYWSIPMQAMFEKRKAFENQKIKSANNRFKDKPEALNKELAKLENEFRVPDDKSYYLNHLTGEQAIVHWHHRSATNPNRHRDMVTSMPDPGSDFAVVQPGDRQALIVELDDSLPENGTMRVRIRACRAEHAGECFPSLQLSFGFRSTDQGSFLKRVSEQDVRIEASFGNPAVYQWDISLGEIEYRNPYRGKSKPGGSPNSSEFIRFTNSSLTNGTDDQNLAVWIEHVEVVAPFYQQWPPKSHRRVFIDSQISEDETAYAQEIIAAFMRRAWRRSPSTKEVDRKLQMFQRLRPDCQDFHQAIVEVLATVLTSPKFLYVLPGESNASDRLTQSELATRLSFFLWCSLPDDKLLSLASTNRLSDPPVLRQQVERMLADPRAARFHQHFVQQWLQLQPLEFLTANRSSNGLDSALLESLKKEPIVLFADMLQNDSSILEFIDSDYAVINERLAKHYGITGVQGNHFRRVSVPPARNRGGLLTQASMLTMNSDGKDSHPVKRGVWLLTNILGDPPPPPPAAVPEIDLTDPEILKLTLKQRIERHRDHAACLSCHQKIDPWGIAFENFDALGRWRNKIDHRSVDATSELPAGVTLDGVTGLKKYLVQNRSDQFVRTTVEKMAAFALGRQLDFADRASITEITQRVRKSGDGVRTMVIQLVLSDLFQAR